MAALRARASRPGSHSSAPAVAIMQIALGGVPRSNPRHNIGWDRDGPPQPGQEEVTIDTGATVIRSRLAHQF